MHHGPRRSGTRAGTPRTGWGTQTEHCVQTNSVHSYCVSAGCRGRHTWGEERAEYLMREKIRKKGKHSEAEGAYQSLAGPRTTFLV